MISKLGGDSFTSGAVSAGINQFLQNQLSQITDPALQQWISATIGAVASKLAGGNAQTGASVAANETKNNYLSHWQKEQRQKAIDEGDWEKVAYWDAIDKAQDQAMTALNLYPGIDLDAPENYDLLQAVSKLGQEIESSASFHDMFLKDIQIVDYSTLMKAGAVGTAVVVLGVTLYRYNGVWVKATPVGATLSKWGEASFQNEAKLVDHFSRHANEWGNITKIEYVQKARDLLNNSVGGNIQGFTNKLGYTFRYNSATNELAIGHPNGTISTMMKPQNGLTYWLEQVDKYSNL